MDELFAVDAEARRRVIGLTGRHALRQERAKPLLDEIRNKIESAQSIALPSSAFSKACQYALALWTKLTRFLAYPELEPSGEFNASRGSGPQELDTHRQSTSGTEGCGDSLGGGKLSSVEAASARLSSRDPSWPRRCPNPAANNVNSVGISLDTDITSLNYCRIRNRISIPS
jgi:hypothetical protein